MNKQYKIIKLPKGGGKYRTIYAPNKAYKNRLVSLLLDLQQKLHNAETEGVVHGFMRGRGAVSNALKHVGYRYTLSLDLEDFFDSVKADMVKEYLSAEELELCFIDTVARQGLPTSPVIANLAFLKLDSAIKNTISDEGMHVVYTRYADDLIFSFNDESFASRIESEAEKIITRAGFRLNRNKRRLQCAANGRRMITGIGVDERNIYPSRKIKRRIRAALHQQNREQAFGLLSWAECKRPRTFYTDRDLLNKNIFEEMALDVSNDFYLSGLLSFDAYVNAVESDFESPSFAHERDRARWDVQKAAFLAQREAFYQKEKERLHEEKKERRKAIEKRFAAEKEAKEQGADPQGKTGPKAAQTENAAADETKAKELVVDFDALKEIAQEHVENYQKESMARRNIKEETRQANAAQVEKKRALSKRLLAGILPLLLLIGAVSYYYSATKIEVKSTYQLFIETVPYGAKIQILNIKPKYEMGIELKPDNYQIRISKNGYETQTFWIKMEQENVYIKRELKKIRKRKVY
jgi:hypothetical protein